METKIVDEAFEKTLKEDLPTVGERIVGINEETELSEEETEPDKPISDFTKNLIICRYTNAVSEDKDVTTKMMKILKEVSGMTEKEGKLYLQSLSNANINCMSNNSVEFVLKHICNHFVKENRDDIKKQILGDKYIKLCLSDKLSQLFLLMGDMAGVILFTLYALESWYSEPPIGKENSNTD